MKHKLFDILGDLGFPFAGVFQVGANIGQEVEVFRAYGVERAVMVEPLDAAFAELCGAIGGDGRYLPGQALCSDREGLELDFFEASNSQSSSMLAPTGHLQEYPKIRFAEPRKICSTTADAIVEGLAGAPGDFSFESFDVLFLDTQGSELQVMQGARRLLQHVRSIWTEVSCELYDGAAELEDIQAWLRPFGFRLNTLKMNTHGWGDALFVKRALRFL